MDPKRDRSGARTPRQPRLAPWLALLLTVTACSLAGSASAQNVPDPAAAVGEADSLASLRAEISELRRAHEAEIAALEARLVALEAAAQAPAAPTGPTPTPTPAPEVDELAALRAAALDAVSVSATAEAAGTASVPAGSQPSFGRGNLNRLNPEISFTGDFVGVATRGTGSEGRDEFQAREFELDFQSALDPFSRTRWTLAFGPDGEVDVEEGYIAYNALPGGLGLNLGKFRQQFGALNRQHSHALPQSDYPLVLRTFFGDEGLAQTGVSARWLLPHPWASANELTLEVTNGDSEAFGGENFRDFVALAHLKNYWDVSDAAYFEWGLSGAVGKSDAGQGRRIWGSDFTYHWQPPSRAKYRELTARMELLLSELALAGGGRVRAWGGYAYGEGLVAQNFYAGARLDWVEDPLDPGHRTWGLVPYLTWWQSEYVRLRGEYRRFEDQRTDRSSDSLVLQLTWAAGPHKHETY